MRVAPYPTLLCALFLACRLPGLLVGFAQPQPSEVKNLARVELEVAHRAVDRIQYGCVETLNPFALEEFRGANIRVHIVHLVE